MTIDRALLESGIAMLENACRTGLMPPLGETDRHRLRAVVAAVAATLPKPNPMWKVRVWISAVQPPRLFEESDGLQAGMRALSCLSDRFTVRVEIEAP